MTDRVTISVCMVAYNVQDWIAEAIESVLMQRTGYRWELIISDNASTDRTPAIMAEYAARYPDRIRPFFQKTNVGAIQNYAFVLKQARGAYIAILDSDDFWTDPEKLQIQTAFLIVHPEAVLVAHYADELADGVRSDFTNHPEPTFTLIDLLTYRVSIPSFSVMFKNRDFNALPDWYFDSGLGDTALWIYLALMQPGVMHLLPRYMGTYRLRSDSLFHSQSPEAKIRMNLQFYQALLKGLPSDYHHYCCTGLSTWYRALGGEYRQKQSGRRWVNVLKAGVFYARSLRWYLRSLSCSGRQDPDRALEARSSGLRPRIAVLWLCGDQLPDLVELDRIYAQTLPVRVHCAVAPGYARSVRALLPDTVSVHVLDAGLTTDLMAILAAIEGDYVAIIQAGDQWTETDKLARQSAYMDAHTDAVITYHPWGWQTESGTLKLPVSRKCVGSAVDFLSGNMGPIWSSSVMLDPKKCGSAVQCRIRSGFLVFPELPRDGHFHRFSAQVMGITPVSCPSPGGFVPELVSSCTAMLQEVIPQLLPELRFLVWRFYSDLNCLSAHYSSGLSQLRLRIRMRWYTIAYTSYALVSANPEVRERRNQRIRTSWANRCHQFKLTLRYYTSTRYPISDYFGYSRGTPLDRYYIDSFVARYRRHIRGTVLEVGETVYTHTYSEDVFVRPVMLWYSGEPETPVGCDYIRADLVTGAGIPDQQFDCFIMTQTLPVIFDVEQAVANAFKLLKPGGHLLITVPAISQQGSDEMATYGWYWSFTSFSLRRLLEAHVPADCIQLEAFGNMKAAIGFLKGRVVQEFRKADLDFKDPCYEMTVCACVKKPEV